MTADSFNALLERLLSRRPFQTFTVELHGGKRFDIDRPNATVFREGLAVFIAPGPFPIRFDHESVSQFIESPPNAAP